MAKIEVSHDEATAIDTPPSRLKTYASFIKLEHTIFSLPLIFSGTLLHTYGWPRMTLVMWILLAAIGGRVMAMGLNRILDAELDARNPRTRRRELPRGVMAPWEAWIIVAGAGFLYAASAAAIAPICLALSPIPVALFVAYPYLKRFTVLSHLGLGITWSMAPLGGWLAAAATSPHAAVLSGVERTASKSLAAISEIGWLWLFSVLWVTGFDIIYATMDEAFDRKAGLHSLPVTLGKVKALQVATVIHAAAFLALAVLWRTQLYSPIAWWWLFGVGILFIWQHAVAERKPEFAFFQLNSLVAFFVLGLVLAGIR